MQLELQDRVIVVTGGARGIGGAIVRGLVAERAVPFVVDRAPPTEPEWTELLSQGRAEWVTAELARPADCEQALASVLDRCGRIDGLVNNAGRNDGVGLANGDAEKFVESLRNNLVHYYEMARLCLPELKARRGAIVNISSKVAETGQGGTSAYAAANGGRNALTREWATELAPSGVRVNAVIVAECWTPMYESWLSGYSTEDQATLRAQITARIPLGKRMTETREIADAVMFLLSARASHITGQLLHVDGGYVHLDRQ